MQNAVTIYHLAMCYSNWVYVLKTCFSLNYDTTTFLNWMTKESCFFTCIWNQSLKTFISCLCWAKLCVAYLLGISMKSINFVRVFYSNCSRWITCNIQCEKSLKLISKQTMRKPNLKWKHVFWLHQSNDHAITTWSWIICVFHFFPATTTCLLSSFSRRLFHNVWASIRVVLNDFFTSWFNEQL